MNCKGGKKRKWQNLQVKRKLRDILFKYSMYILLDFDLNKVIVKIDL